MKRLFEHVFSLHRALRRIDASSLPRDVKRRLRRSYLSAITLKRCDSRNRMANVAGYKVRFCTYQTFSDLFDSIFIRQGYQFATDKTNPFIIDCGSNIGMSVLYFKMLYIDSEILSFEPDQDAYSCLETNVRLNGLKSVETINKAISNKEGRMDFWFDPDNPGALRMSTIRERMPKKRQVVEVRRLSDYIDREVDFLKMDVEGAELDIINELNDESKLRCVKQMAIEYHHHVVGDADVFSRILRILEDAGFGYQIESNLRRPFRRQTHQDILIYAYRKDNTA